LGLIVMRDFPGSVRSASFCGISPPHFNHFVESVRLYPQVLNALFSRCAADATCHKAYPDLETEFYAVIQRLNDQPAVFEVRLATGGSHTARLSGDQFCQLIWEAMYTGNAVRFLPMLIHDTYDGKVAVLQEYLRLTSGQAQPFFSEGLYHTVNCAEEVGLTTREDVIAAASALRPVLRESVLRGAQANAGRCEDWPVPPINRDERRPVVSDVPTLLLSGEFDSGTPPAFGEAVASKLSNGHHVVLPGLGHCEVYASACMAEIQTRFFDDPTQPLDTRCIANMPKFTFATAE
jgi:pimeloyl-ACP methyl ester carboxylesterase